VIFETRRLLLSYEDADFAELSSPAPMHQMFPLLYRPLRLSAVNIDKGQVKHHECCLGLVLGLLSLLENILKAQSMAPSHLYFHGATDHSPPLLFAERQCIYASRLFCNYAPSSSAMYRNHCNQTSKALESQA